MGIAKSAAMTPTTVSRRGAGGCAPGNDPARSSIARPTTAGSPSKCRRQVSWLKTTTSGFAASAAPSVRPTIACTCRRLNVFGATITPQRPAPPRDVRTVHWPSGINAVVSDNVFARDVQSWNSGTVGPRWKIRPFTVQFSMMRTSRSESGYGSGRSRIVSTTL